MGKKEVLSALTRLEAHVDGEDAVYIKDLYESVKKGRRVLNPDDYIDLLLGTAEAAEADVQADIYAVVDFVTEQYC